MKEMHYKAPDLFISKATLELVIKVFEAGDQHPILLSTLKGYLKRYEPLAEGESWVRVKDRPVTVLSVVPQTEPES